MKTVQEDKARRKKGTRYVGCSLPPDVYEAVKSRAARESRSLSAEVCVAVRRHVEGAVNA